VKEDFPKFKKYVLKNVELAGREMLGVQKSYMRDLYRGLSSADSIEKIIKTLEEFYEKAPIGKPLKKNWPAPKYAIRWVWLASGFFSDDPINDEYFAGFPGAYDPPFDNEQEENDREKALCYD
jgi:hypothetical protein